MRNAPIEFSGILAAADTQNRDLLLPIILGAIAIMAFIVFGCWLASKKRTEGFKGAAEQLKLPFYPKGDDLLIGRLNQFHLFSKGRSKKIINMLHGESNGVELAIFDYRYTVGHGKHTRTHYQTAIFFCSPMLSLTPFEMRPETVFHKVAGLFGHQDIDFESHPRFSRKYLLRGEDEPRVRELFTPAVLSFVESQKKICVEGGGDQLVFYRHSVKIKPAATREFMQEGMNVFALFQGST